MCERAWPPSAGFSFVCWLYVEEYGGGVLRLFQISAKKGDGGAHTTEIMIGRFSLGFLSVQTGASEVAQFSSFR